MQLPLAVHDKDGSKMDVLPEHVEWKSSDPNPSRLSMEVPEPWQDPDKVEGLALASP
jgi:hypothetical protein